ncbi:MAG: hypothetical protein K6U02_03940 [Firmicutes bacterium]|nr:hypothetical protein [Bacillota bacterium]
MQVLSEGQRLNHPQYGLGVVRESDAERTTIDFDEYGEKKFVTSLMTAELIGEPPAPTSRNRSQRRRASRATARRKAPGRTTSAND